MAWPRNETVVGSIPAGTPQRTRSDAAKDALKGKDGTDGVDGRDGVDGKSLTGLEADGPYPSNTDLSKLSEAGSQGSNSTELVPGDEGAAAHTVWVKCADGKVALGGGFRLASDASLADKKAVQVIASEPTGDQIKDDAAGSVMPTRLEGSRSSTTASLP